MSYQKIKCPRGHVFSTNVYSKHQRIECPDCRSSMRSSVDDISSYTPSFTVSESSATDWPSSSSDSYSSGGGGDFGGGGASGDY